jgi:hypothetical protein
MHTLKTHWIDIQSYKASLIQTKSTATILQDRRMSSWYRRLRFYFFESEITARVRAETSTHIENDGLDTLFVNPELQALAQRAGLQYMYPGLRDAT